MSQPVPVEATPSATSISRAPVMVALYCRVSTEEQSPDMQRRDLLQYCAQRGWTVYREYIDHGISGTQQRRRGLDQLMAACRQRKIDAVVCWRFDRLARSTKHLIAALEEFQYLGIAFVSYQEAIDTSSPLGKVMYTIISALAEFERDLIASRIKAGLRAARARGTRIGRPGLATPELRHQIGQLHRQGQSLRTISRAMGVSRSLVHRIVHTL